MMNVTRFAAVLGLSLAFLGTSIGQQVQPAQTVVTIPTMDCAGCAKKINTHLQTVPGIAQVAMNLDAHQLFVTPQPNVGVSPKLIWEAAEKAGFTPSKMETPYGVFNAKPRS